MQQLDLSAKFYSFILKDCLPAVSMIGWHVARHWAAGDWEELRSFIKMASMFKRLIIWRSVFIIFGTKSLVKGWG